MTEPRVTDEAVTTPIFRIRGQRSRWRYPDERLTPEHCEILRDVNISDRGAPETRYGYAAYNSTQYAGGEAIVGIWQGTFADDTERVVIVTPTKVYVDDGTTRTDITGVALTGGNEDRVMFDFIKDQLIINNGVDAPRTWNGALATDTSDLATVPWTIARGSLVHKNLLMFWGTTEGGTLYPTRLRWCDIDRAHYVVDVNTWLDANRYEIYDGGPAIVGAVDAWGKALIFKADGLYPGEITYGMTGYYDFNLDKPQRGFSPIAKTSILARPELVCGVAKEGCFIITPDMAVQIVTLDDSDEWLGLNKGRYKYSHAMIREKEHQVRWLVSSADNTAGHDRVLCFDWDTGDVWLDRPTGSMNVAASVMISNEELDLLGTTDGFLYQGNKSTYNDDAGTSYAWQIKMSPNDLGLPGKQKHVLNVKTLYRNRAGSSTVNVKINIDEGRSSSVRGTITARTGSTWNSGKTWNSGVKWYGASPRIGDTYVNRICETVAPEWTGNTPSAIEGYLVEYVPLEQ